MQRKQRCPEKDFEKYVGSREISYAGNMEQKGSVEIKERVIIHKMEDKDV